jgi:hypothetical protein
LPGASAAGVVAGAGVVVACAYTAALAANVHATATAVMQMIERFMGPPLPDCTV